MFHCECRTSSPHIDLWTNGSDILPEYICWIATMEGRIPVEIVGDPWPVSSRWNDCRWHDLYIRFSPYLRWILNLYTGSLTVSVSQHQNVTNCNALHRSSRYKALPVINGTTWWWVKSNMDVPTQVEGDDLFKEWFYQKAKLNCYSYVQGTHSWLE